MRKSGCDLRAFGPIIENLKSKSGSADKMGGALSIVVALAVCGARADASRQRKCPASAFSIQANVSHSAVRLAAFRQELSKLGWIEGKNITIEYRFAEEKSGRQPELAVDLVRLRLM